jgi:hypothetical protein
MSSAQSEIEKSSLDVGRSTPVVTAWHPPPSHPPPQVRAAGSTDGRAIAALLAAIGGIVLGLPFGLPGMVLGTLAYFLGKSAVDRIDGANGALGGRGLAVASWVLGAVAMGIGAAVTLTWLVVALLLITQPTPS